MMASAIDVDVIPERSTPAPKIDERTNLQKIRDAIDKTQEVMNDPDAIMSERKLPKAGNDPMDFETEEYTK